MYLHAHEPRLLYIYLYIYILLYIFCGMGERGIPDLIAAMGAESEGDWSGGSILCLTPDSCAGNPF